MKKLLYLLLFFNINCFAEKLIIPEEVNQMYEPTGIKLNGNLFIGSQIINLNYCRITNVPTVNWVNAGTTAIFTANGTVPDTLAFKYYFNGGIPNATLQVTEIVCLDKIFQNGFD